MNDSVDVAFNFHNFIMWVILLTLYKKKHMAERYETMLEVTWPLHSRGLVVSVLPAQPLSHSRASAGHFPWAPCQGLLVLPSFVQRLFLSGVFHSSSHGPRRNHLSPSSLCSSGYHATSLPRSQPGIRTCPCTFRPGRVTSLTLDRACY